MKRRDFVTSSLLGVTAMSTLKDLHAFGDELPSSGQRMPVLFVGHGSPMNAIEENEFSVGWKTIGREVPKPRAILCVSAHWETRGTFVTAMEKPRTIHDFGGFPPELYEVQYPAPGNPHLAEQTITVVKKAVVELDQQWGLDHGCWSVVGRMFPNADIPVLQLSIDHARTPDWHFELAGDLSTLRNKGVLVIGSGNMVHNLRMMNWEHPDESYDWAAEMNLRFKDAIVHGNTKPLLDYPSLGKAAMLAVPTAEHFIPMLYALGLKEKNEQISFFNDKMVMGSISMTSFRIS